MPAIFSFRPPVETCALAPFVNSIFAQSAGNSGDFVFAGSPGWAEIAGTFVRTAPAAQTCCIVWRYHGWTPDEVLLYNRQFVHRRGTDAKGARPQTDPESSSDQVSDEGQPASERASLACHLGGKGPLRPDSAGAKGRAPLYASRRASLRQRPHPFGNRTQQDPEGLHHQGEDVAGIQRSLCSGLGLPRLAHRDQC